MVLGAAFAATLAAVPADATPAKPDKPNTACQQAGMSALKSLGVFSAVAEDGVDAGTLKALGVRGIDAVADETVFRLPQVLALHRSSPELFPWCDGV